MKKLLIVSLAAFSLALPAMAQDADPTPTPTPAPLLQLPKETKDSVAPVNAAAQIIQQINYTLINVDKLLTEGVPARKATANSPAVDAITPDAIKAALGADNVAKLQAAIAALKKK